MGVLGELLVKDTGLGQGKKREKTPEAQHRDRGGGELQGAKRELGTEGQLEDKVGKGSLGKESSLLTAH